MVMDDYVYEGEREAQQNVLARVCDFGRFELFFFAGANVKEV